MGAPANRRISMKKLVLAISTVALFVSTAYADPIADRKAIMKERGGLVGGIAKMAKGETAFDAAAVLTALQALQANEAKVDIDALFPAGSDKGDTKADLDAAVAKPATSVEELGAQLGVLGGDCGGCHKPYRLPSA
jgi:cytochrome c556